MPANLGEAKNNKLLDYFYQVFIPAVFIAKL